MGRALVGGGSGFRCFCNVCVAPSSSSWPPPSSLVPQLRARDPASRGDRYMLVTYDEPPYCIKVKGPSRGWGVQKQGASRLKRLPLLVLIRAVLRRPEGRAGLEGAEGWRSPAVSSSESLQRPRSGEGKPWGETTGEVGQWRRQPLRPLKMADILLLYELERETVGAAEMERSEKREGKRPAPSGYTRGLWPRGRASLRLRPGAPAWRGLVFCLAPPLAPPSSPFQLAAASPPPPLSSRFSRPLPAESAQRQPRALKDQTIAFALLWSLTRPRPMENLSAEQASQPADQRNSFRFFFGIGSVFGCLSYCWCFIGDKPRRDGAGKCPVRIHTGQHSLQEPGLPIYILSQVCGSLVGICPVKYNGRKGELDYTKLQ